MIIINMNMKMVSSSSVFPVHLTLYSDARVIDVIGKLDKSL